MDRRARRDRRLKGNQPGLFDRDPGLADHARPTVDRFLQERGRVRQRERERLIAERPQALISARAFHTRVDVGVELGGDTLRDLRGREETVPAADLDALEARLLQGLYIGQRTRALRS